MKLHITREDLAQLTEAQRYKLSSLWQPEKYDPAVARICTDVSDEEYEEIEFVVGGIEIYNYTTMILHDLRTINHGQPKGTLPPGPALSNPSPFPSIDQINHVVDAIETPFKDTEEAEEEEFSEEAFDIQPTSFNKEECLPLLNIGQMIDILQRSEFGYNEFYLYASAGPMGCEFGRSPDMVEFEPAELCDVLWESVKAVL